MTRSNQQFEQQQPNIVEQESWEEKIPVVEDEHSSEAIPKVEEFSQEKVGDIKESSAKFDKEGREEFERLSVEFPAFDRISQKYQSLLESNLQKIRSLRDSAVVRIQQFTVAASLFVSTFGTAEAQTLAQNTEKISPDSTIETVHEDTDVPFVEKPMVTKEITYAEGMNEFRKAVFSDNHEKFGFSYEENGKHKMVIENGKTNFACVPYDQLADILKKTAGNVEITHDHPLPIYPQLKHMSAESIGKSIKAGKIIPSPMPPSMADIASVMHENNHFKGNENRIKNKVVDATGEWSFGVDQHNLFIEKYSELIQYGEKIGDDEFMKQELELTDEEIKTIKNSTPNNIENVHPQLLLQALKDTAEWHSIAQKFEDKIMEKTLELFSQSQDTLVKFGMLNNASNEILNFDATQDKRDINELIAKYIEDAKEVGVIISYKPVTQQ